MQQDRDFLFVTRAVFCRADNQWRGEQALFLQGVGVHPMGAARADRELIIPALLSREQGGRIVWYAIHVPGRRQAVPVDKGILGRLVEKADVEVRARIQHEAGVAAAVCQPEDRGGLAVDVQRPLADE